MSWDFWRNVLACSVPILLLIVILSVFKRPPGEVVEYLVTIILALIAGMVLAAMANGTIKLDKLISEDNGSASLSRFQFLIFTFVIGGSYFLMMVLYAGRYPEMYKAMSDAAVAVNTAAAEANAAASKANSSADTTAAIAKLQTAIDTVKDVFRFQLPDIPNGVLGLIGLSGGSYVIAKGIQKSNEGDPGLGVKSITVVTHGKGYTPSTTVQLGISGGGGVNAAAVANIDSEGSVKDVTVSSPGSGYTNVPSVTIPPPTGQGAEQAALKAVLGT